MSLEMDVKYIKNLFEQESDPFVPVDPEELETRKSEDQKRLIRLKQKAADLFGKGVEAWRNFPEQAWPEIVDEGVCPVCGTAYYHTDYSEAYDTSDWTYERHIYHCHNCESESTQNYEIVQNYLDTNVIELPPARNESVNEQEETDPFQPADPEDVGRRKEVVARERQRREEERKRKEEEMRAGLKAELMQSGPPEMVYAMVIDQGDESYVKLGKYWYDEGDDLFLDEDGKWWSRQELEDEHGQEYSGFMPVGVMIKTREELESIIRDIQSVLNPTDSEE